MAAWPAYAEILADGFGVEDESAAHVTEMETGPQKRSQFAARIKRRRFCRVLLKSQSDFNSFDSWLNTTLNGKTDSFTWTDPVDSTSKTAWIDNAEVGRAETQAGSLSRWVVPLTIVTWEDL